MSWSTTSANQTEALAGVHKPEPAAGFQNGGER